MCSARADKEAGSQMWEGLDAPILYAKECVYESAVSCLPTLTADDGNVGASLLATSGFGDLLIANKFLQIIVRIKRNCFYFGLPAPVLKIGDQAPPTKKPPAHLGRRQHN